jgi:single-strand DNA-binding protein
MTGNLTADIETREINANRGEQHLSKFTLACNEGERVVFIPVEAWNMAHLPEYLSKGSKVLISGALKQDHWETDAGDKRSRIVLTAYKVEFLDPAPENPARAKQSSGTDKRRGKNYSRNRAA